MGNLPARQAGCLAFQRESDFSRRRNTWYIVTIAAFICPSFFVFALVVTPFLVMAGEKTPIRAPCISR